MPTTKSGLNYVVDDSPPLITISTPLDGGEFGVGDVVPAVFGCTDVDGPQAGGQDLSVVGRVVGQQLPISGGLEQLGRDRVQGGRVLEVLVADAVHRGGGWTDLGAGAHQGAEQDLAGEVDDADLDDVAEQVGGLGVQDDGVLAAETRAGPAAHLDGAELAAEAADGLHTQGRFLDGDAVTRGAHGDRSPSLSASRTPGVDAGRLVGPGMGWCP